MPQDALDRLIDLAQVERLDPAALAAAWADSVVVESARDLREAAS